MIKLYLSLDTGTIANLNTLFSFTITLQIFYIDNIAFVSRDLRSVQLENITTLLSS